MTTCLYCRQTITGFRIVEQGIRASCLPCYRKAHPCPHIPDTRCTADNCEGCKEKKS